MESQISKRDGLTFEAEGILGNLSDEGFDDEINCLYSEAYADLKIKQGDKKEALPYLETAISLEKTINSVPDSAL